MRTNYIKCGDCLKLIEELPSHCIDVVLTSPPYATNEKAGKSRTLSNTKVKEGQYDYVRYDVFTDFSDAEEYYSFSKKVFNKLDRVLKPNGVVLYNLSYGGKGAGTMIHALNSIIEETAFDVADIICWKKKSVLPNTCSSNKLTRICEYIFVLCRKNEFKTFYSNKQIVSSRPTGQLMYNSIHNFVEAKNNDGPCPYNKATFSSDLVEKMLEIYAPQNAIVLDPFNGTGSTGVACVRMGLNYIGFELSRDQCKWSVERIRRVRNDKGRNQIGVIGIGNAI